MNDLLVRLREPLSVFHVPAEDFQEWIDELDPELRFQVGRILVILALLVKAGDQGQDFGGTGHQFAPRRYVVWLRKQYSETGEGAAYSSIL